MRSTVACVASACLLSLAAPLFGSVIPLEVEDLTANAEQIVVGDVVEVTSSWNAAHDLIESRIVVKVDDYLLGSGTGTETLTITGGTVDNMTLHVSVFPMFRTGDHVLLFLDNGTSRLVGAFQGAYLTDGTSIARMGAACRRMIPDTLRPLPQMLEDIKGALKEGRRLPKVKPYIGSFALTPEALRFGNCGYDWTYLDAPVSVTYSINATAEQSCGGPPETQRAQVIKGMETWNDAGACFEFRYDGPLACELGFDKINCVHFAYDLPFPGFVVAANLHWVDGTRMVESDIIFNARDYVWWHGSGVCCDMDIWNVAAHEFGHTLCLLDLYEDFQSGRTMYGYIDFCDRFARTLHADDIDGIRSIYGECTSAGACCDGVTCTGTMLEDDCAYVWHEGEECAFFRCPSPACNVESFESGDFSAFPWVHLDDSDWRISNSESTWGDFSAQAGSTRNSEKSSLQVTLDCVPGDITFNHMVSSEVNFDYLRFYMNGVFQDSWSGFDTWQEDSYPVSAGMNTFKWSYGKDGSAGAGADTGWIDDIVFPIDCIGDCCASSVSSYPHCTGFETGLGDWVDDTADDFDWQRAIGTTPVPLTGPQSAHGGRIYVYTSALWYPDKTARLDLCFDLTTASRPKLTFWYHMYGAEMGTLSVGLADQNCADWTTIWSESGDQGDQWREAQIDLSAHSGRRIMLSFAGHTGAGDTSDMALDDICVSEAPSCVGGDVVFLDPPSGVVDARQPHPPTNVGDRQGFDSFLVQAPPGADNLRCWSRCESAMEGTANAISGVSDNGDGTFTVSLVRPISTGAVTTLTYTDDDGTAHTGTFTSHPGNVNGDSRSAPADVLNIIDYLNGVAAETNCPWGLYSGDVDRSDVIAPADVLMVIDLLNGAGEFDPWSDTPLPPCGTCCP